MKLLKKGDKLKKGDVILVKNRIVVSITENYIFGRNMRVGAITHRLYEKGEELIDLLDSKQFCVWESIFDYYKVDEKEALAYLI